MAIIQSLIKWFRYVNLNLTEIVRFNLNANFQISGSFRRLEKFESSTYSEVLKAVDMSDNNKPVVMKIMRAFSKGVMKLIPTSAARGSQSYTDILNELVVVQALSQLHEGVKLNGKSVYKTHFFCQIYEIKVVNGNLDRVLSSSAPKTKADKQQAADDKKTKDDDLKLLSETERMLIEALPLEYVITVMKHDGQPLWWMMTHKKLTPEQLASSLVQVIVGLAIAEKVYSYEHRDLHVSNILIRKTSEATIPFILDGSSYKIVTNGIKATIIDATFSRLTHNGKVYYRDLTSTLRAYGTKKVPVKMSLQNRSYRQMVHLTNNNWEEFKPKTNLIWLTYLCETLMKNDILKSDAKLLEEVRKIRDHTLKVANTLELLSYFPFEREKSLSTKSVSSKVSTQSVKRAPQNTKIVANETPSQPRPAIMKAQKLEPSSSQGALGTSASQLSESSSQKSSTAIGKVVASLGIKGKISTKKRTVKK